MKNVRAIYRWSMLATDLTYADLTGANFEGAKVANEQLAKAKTVSLKNVTLPNGGTYRSQQETSRAEGENGGPS